MTPVVKTWQWVACLNLRASPTLHIDDTSSVFEFLSPDHFTDLVAGYLSHCPKNYSYDSSITAFFILALSAAYPAFKYTAHAPSFQSHSTLDSISWRPTWNPPMRSQPYRKTATMINNLASLSKQQSNKR